MADSDRYSTRSGSTWVLPHVVVAAAEMAYHRTAAEADTVTGDAAKRLVNSR